MRKDARMQPSPTEGGDAKDATSQTLADLLSYFGKSSSLRRELEAFRISYEAKFGETDLIKRYTSVWPNEQQEWLLKNYPKRYYDGLPPFVKAFMKEKMHTAKRDGKLDDMPGTFLSLYLSGQMEVDDGGYSR